MDDGSRVLRRRESVLAVLRGGVVAYSLLVVGLQSAPVGHPPVLAGAAALLLLGAVHLVAARRLPPAELERAALLLTLADALTLCALALGGDPVAVLFAGVSTLVLAFDPVRHAWRWLVPVPVVALLIGAAPDDEFSAVGMLAVCLFWGAVVAGLSASVRRGLRARDRAQAELDLVFERGVVAAALLDRDGRVLRANPALLQLLQDEDPCDRDAVEVLGGPDRAGGLDDALRRARLGEMPAPLEVAVPVGDDVHHVRVRVSALPADHAGQVHAVLQLEDVNADRRHSMVLRRQARTDGLTGLANRRVVEEVLDERPPPDGLLLLLDLDGFKQVNDRLGHAAGDRLLVVTADRLQAICTRPDLVARLAGDELVVLLADEGDDPAGRARAVVEALRGPVEIDGTSVTCTASAGAVRLREHPGSGASDLLRAADAALYTAKRAGRDRAVLAPGQGEVVEVPTQAGPTDAAVVVEPLQR